MGSYPPNYDGGGFIGDLYLEPMVVAPDIENNDVGSQEARGSKSIPDFLGRSPDGPLCLGKPGFNPSAGIGMFLHECRQFVAADYLHL